MQFSGIKALIVLAALGTSLGVRAQDQAPRDWPRFYVGFAVGPSQLGLDMAEAGVPEEPWGNRSLGASHGKKLVVGFRPVHVVGVELERIDFGEAEVLARAGESHGSGQVTWSDQLSGMDASAEGTALSAVLFVPNESPWWEIYGKVGAALVDESFAVFALADDYPTPGCRLPFMDCAFRNQSSGSDSGPYVGFGARFKIAPAVGVRVEYEAFDRDGGDSTQLITVGVAAEF